MTAQVMFLNRALSHPTLFVVCVLLCLYPPVTSPHASTTESIPRAWDDRTAPVVWSHAHLLRQLEKTDKNNTSEAWCAFSKKLRRLIMDAIRLRCREDFSPERYAGCVDRIEKRLMLLLAQDTQDHDVNRLRKRLRRHQNDLWTFLHRMDIPYDNNFAEWHFSWTTSAILLRSVRPLSLFILPKCRRVEKMAGTSPRCSSKTRLGLQSRQLLRYLALPKSMKKWPLRTLTVKFTKIESIL